VARDDYDVNDSSTYTPREAPRVLKAPPRGTAVETGGMPPRKAEAVEYLFDGQEGWNEPLDDLPSYRSAPRAEAPAAVDPANPYAKKRDTPAGRGRAPRAKDAGAGVSFQGRPVLYAAVIIVCMAILAATGVFIDAADRGIFLEGF
jgi:hypothetical protein